MMRPLQGIGRDPVTPVSLRTLSLCIPEACQGYPDLASISTFPQTSKSATTQLPHASWINLFATLSLFPKRALDDLPRNDSVATL